jgi:hypothetical protein
MKQLKSKKMKTKMLSLVMLILSVNTLFAHSINEKNKQSKADTALVKETTFTMKMNPETDELLVEVNGNFDQYSSVSVTNTRGSEYCFQFIPNEQGQMIFDLTKLEKGSYFLVLNTKEEIRIKRFVIN